MLSTIDSFNLQFWARPEAAEYYSLSLALQPPEQTILRLLGTDLRVMKMLDIGVGAGRTSAHFAPLVAEYVGIDYSEAMIRACRKRFACSVGSASFHVCDARAMEMFKDNEFDFILFSFNGLDYIGHEDRIRALKEVHRVGKPGSLFSFSTHNLNYSPRLFELHPCFAGGPRTVLKNVKRWMQLTLLHNAPLCIYKLKQSQYALLNDGAHNYNLAHYYIRPRAQLKQLAGYFDDVRTIDADGRERSGAEIDDMQDWWIYFLCKNAKELTRG